MVVGSVDVEQELLERVRTLGVVAVSAARCDVTLDVALVVIHPVNAVIDKWVAVGLIVLVSLSWFCSADKAIAGHYFSETYNCEFEGPGGFFSSASVGTIESLEVALSLLQPLAPFAGGSWHALGYLC